MFFFKEYPFGAEKYECLTDKSEGIGICSKEKQFWRMRWTVAEFCCTAAEDRN